MQSTTQKYSPSFLAFIVFLECNVSLGFEAGVRMNGVQTLT